ncbi:DUF2628 domain-containing protein [Lottiidibacillus patelloidae]|uniref:DUF2628 domain-containing protein n=1 Tax=Lottiidibacillus patelloidae TaxID=2670334 RepID=UPI00130305C7|nr:DUF2628 domain-containing protein [Lottiidibacillus patelloidae]
MYCSKCGNKVTEDALFCSACGEKVIRIAAKNDESNAREDEKFEEIKANKTSEEEVIVESQSEDLSTEEPNQDEVLAEAYVGSKYPYYKEKWVKMDETGSGGAGNIAAFFLGVFWLGYRKMYRELLFIALAFLLIDFLLVYVINYQYSTESFIDPVDSVIGLAASILMAIFGNKLYKSHVDRKIEKIKKEDSNFDETIKIAKRKGGNRWLGVLIALGVFLAYSFLTSYIAPSNLDAIYAVQGGAFYDYPEKTVEEAFDDFFLEGEWEYISQNTPYDVVLFRGLAPSKDGLDELDVEVKFILDPDNKSFELTEVIIEGKSYTSDEDINEFLEIVYE